MTSDTDTSVNVNVISRPPSPSRSHSPRPTNLSLCHQIQRNLGPSARLEPATIRPSPLGLGQPQLAVYRIPNRDRDPNRNRNRDRHHAASIQPNPPPTSFDSDSGSCGDPTYPGCQHYTPLHSLARQSLAPYALRPSPSRYQYDTGSDASRHPRHPRAPRSTRT